MYVYVLNENGEPLMPTKNFGKVRKWLRDKKAKVIRRIPFTVQRLFKGENNIQPVILAQDTGYEYVGISCISEKAELFSGEFELRTDISERLNERSMYRRNRRRRLWYRPPRFNNRGRKKDLTPSVEHKLNSHIKIIEYLKKILPISEIVIETASFNIQKIKNPDISGKEYQEGNQLGYSNVRNYIIARDSGKCYFNTKRCSKKLQVHHIVERCNGGTNKPDNLVTLCEKCHKSVHKGTKKLNIKKHKSYKSATFMNIIRKRLLEYYPEARVTFGYQTKNYRESLRLEKSHINDAFAIAKGKDQSRCVPYSAIFKRRNNRSLQKNRKGYKPSIRKKRYPLQPMDIVKCEGREYYVVGTQSYGKQVKLGKPDSKDIVKSVKKVELVYHQKSMVFNLTPPLKGRSFQSR